jgi:hypothetical protein
MQMGAPETLTVVGDAITNSLQTQQQWQQQQPYDWLFGHMTTALAQGHAMSTCKSTHASVICLCIQRALMAVHTSTEAILITISPCGKSNKT